MNGNSDRLGQIAVSQGFLDESSLTTCLELQRQFATGGNRIQIGQILIARGHISNMTLDALLGMQKAVRSGAQVAELSTTPGFASEDVTVIDPNVAEAQLNQIAREAQARPEAAGAVTLDGQGRLGEYVLEKRLSRGGMGAVYLARKGSEPRLVALKVLDPAGGSTDEMVVRFRREAQFLLALSHPHVVAAYDVGSTEGRHYLAMEYVEGENLDARVRRDGPMEPAVACSVMRQVADALLYAESRAVVHRDVKPANVLIRQDGIVKLADMGLAILQGREDLRLTAPGTLVGTPAFMSPEQVEAKRDLDARSDVYSFGCTFFHTVCGRPPFLGQIIALCQQHLRSAPPRPSDLRPGLMPDVEAMLLTCLQKPRAARYQSFSEIVRELDRIVASAKPTKLPKHDTKVEIMFGFAPLSGQPRPGRKRTPPPLGLPG